MNATNKEIMKFKIKATIFLALVLQTFFVMGQRKEPIPPGTIKVGDNLFMDETEITNFYYKEFLFALKKEHGEDSPELKAAQLPLNQVVRIGVDDAPEILLETYFNHPAYHNYPVICVTYEQAMAYCEWRSKKVNELLALQAHKDERNRRAPMEFKTTVKYRLPSKEEWLNVAQVGIPSKKEKKLNKLQIPTEKRDETLIAGNFSEAENEMPESAFAGIPNKFGLFQMYGNVGELINQKDKYMGSGYDERLEHFKLDQVVHAEMNEPTVGFRCVAEFVH